jgi:hypothetical protein
VVKTAGRAIAECALFLAFLADFHKKVKPELEGLTALSAKDKKRHSPRRRVLRYVTTGGVVRAKV